MPVYPGDGITFPYVYADSCRATGAALPTISFVILVLRLYARRLQGVRLGWDDYTAVFAWIFLACMGGIFVYGSDHGLCWPSPPVPAGLTEQEFLNYNPTDTRNLDKQEYYFQPFMTVTNGLTKISIVLFLRRIHLGFLFAYIFICGTHVSAAWGTPAQSNAYCQNADGGGGQLNLALGGSELALDVVCFLVPFPMIWRLHLSLIQKFLLTGIFMVGCMTIASSIARLVIYVQVLNTASDPTEDLNLTVSLVLWWSLLEAGLAFIASQLPLLSRYVVKLTPGFFSKQFRSLHSCISTPLRSGNEKDSSHTLQAIHQPPTQPDQVRPPRQHTFISVDSWEIRSQLPTNKHFSHEVSVEEDGINVR